MAPQGGLWGDALLTPWWLRDSGEALLTRCDAHLLLISRMLHAHGAGTATLAMSSATAPDRAAAAIWVRANSVVADYITVAQNEVLRARLSGRREEHVAVAAEAMATLSAITTHCTTVLQRRRDWAARRAAMYSPGGAAAPPVSSLGPSGSPGLFWSTFMAVAQGEAVPTARMAHPRLAGMLERAVRSVLAGEVV